MNSNYLEDSQSDLNTQKMETTYRKIEVPLFHKIKHS